MPPLSQNIEGLRTHSLLVNTFIPDPEVSDEMRKWRSWLIHCLVKTARHYEEARSTIQAQIDEASRTSAEMAKGRGLPILDFAFAMEDCITSLEKAVVCMNALEKQGAMPGARLHAMRFEREALNALRRQQEHMHLQVAGGQTGEGPIFVTVSEDGEGMRFRKLSMSFIALCGLIDAVYRDISALYPKHAVDSPPTRGGAPVLSITATMEVITSGNPTSGAA